MAWLDYTGIVAGTLIIGVGIFVLAAKPGAPLVRIFFVLAIMDGASTILYGLSTSVVATRHRVYFWATYWYHFIAFIALLAVFGVVFPKPVAHAWLRRTLLAVSLLLGATALFLYAVDHSRFWTPSPTAPIPVTFAPAGNLVNMSFVLAIALLTLRLAVSLRTERSESHRRQGAYVLGGMALAYLPYPITVVAQDLAIQGADVFLEGRWDRVMAHWVFLAAAGGMCVAGAVLMRGVAEEAKDERRFVLSCFAAVLALGIFGFLFPDLGIGILLRRIALLAYPVLLGWAIVRYEVFDIDRKLRRAASITFATMGITLAFILAENAMENLLQQSVFGGIPSAWVSGSVAALITAGVSFPVARASRKAASRIVPELSHDELYGRKLEIYRHSLAGALADGILREGESRTLAALRSSLGISDVEHQRLLSEVAA